MTERTGRTRDTTAHALAIQDLVSYRLSRAASLMSRGAALRYRREFGVSLGEWRALALLATGVPPSLTQLARSAGLDKAQMSRVVSSLVTRGLVARDADDGGRPTRLTLTPVGRALYASLSRRRGSGTAPSVRRCRPRS